MRYLAFQITQQQQRKKKQQQKNLINSQKKRQQMPNLSKLDVEIIRQGL